MDVNWIAVLAAAASSFVLGGLWYAPKVFGGSFVLSLLAAAMFAVFLGKVDPVTGAGYGFSAGLFWVATSFGINYLFERKPLMLFLVNGGYHTVQFTLIGLILGLLP